MSKNTNNIKFGGHFMQALEDEFGGCCVKNVYITKVIFSNPATIIMWSDGTKTVSKTHAGDTYNAETGFALAYLKKVVGATEVRNAVNDWVVNTDYSHAVTRTVHDVRESYKNK